MGGEESANLWRSKIWFLYTPVVWKSTIPEITNSNKTVVNKIENLVSEISFYYSTNNIKNSNVENEVDQLVYKLYDLTEEEIQNIYNRAISK